MRIVRPSVEILTPIDGEQILKNIEVAGRICYQSQDKITNESAKLFVANIIKRKHLAVIEHESITVKFTCDRGVSHEAVRHRLASFCQSSSRYCNYSNDKFGSEITVIDLASGFNYDLSNPIDVAKYNVWGDACKYAEKSYMQMIKLGATPQEARSVLPNSTMTELIMTCNLREWRTVLELRTSAAAHPQFRELSIPLLNQFKSKIPIIFDDINT